MATLLHDAVMNPAEGNVSWSQGEAAGPVQRGRSRSGGRAASWPMGLLAPVRRCRRILDHVLKGLEKGCEHLSSGIPVHLNRASQGGIHGPVASVPPGSMLKC